MNGSDMELLRRYAREGTEAAFTELVRQHAGLVYSAALRQTEGDAHLAEDVTQLVFTALARKARRLTRHTSLAGWLYTSTRYAAAGMRRAEARRCAREQVAQSMNEFLQSDPTEGAWEQLRPVLDEAMHDLKVEDREAVLLRFFERLPFTTVGARLGVREDAARRRVERALEKLRAALVSRGITSTAAALGGLLTAQAVGATPAGLVATVSSAAVASTGATSLGAALWAKLLSPAGNKLLAGAVGAVVLAGVATVILLKGATPRYGPAPAYRAAGVLECSFFRSDGSLRLTQSLHFEVKVDARKWQITNFEEGGKRWVRGSDGGDIYHVFRDEADFPHNPALIEPGPMPWGDYPCAVVWLALASGEYLHETKSMFAAWTSPYDEPRAFGYEPVVESLAQPPHLPQTVDFIGSASRLAAFPKSRYVKREGASETAQRQAEERIQEVSVGFLGGHYQVLAFTNFQGAILPTRFRLDAYRPEVGPPGAKNTPVAATYEGRLTQLEKVSMESALPDISDKPVWVSDLRFRDDRLPLDSIGYSLTNRWITSTNDPRLLAVKAEKIESLPR